VTDAKLAAQDIAVLRDLTKADKEWIGQRREFTYQVFKRFQNHGLCHMRRFAGTSTEPFYRARITKLGRLLLTVKP
jgi:hypothetical protein